MAAEPPRRFRDSALGVVGAVTIGAVSASLVAAPAVADDPGYPSWADVQAAKANKAAAEAESARITALIGDLQNDEDAAGRTASIAAERYHRAQLAEDAARATHTQLAQQADRAAAVARTSRMRAGLLAASIARSGGSDLQLMLDASGADDFLHKLATVSQLSAQTQAITDQALQDENEARSLGAQADTAGEVLTQRANAAKAALDAAQQAVDAAGRAVAAQQQHADRLIAQLAELRGTSTRVAAQYAAGVRAEQEERAQQPSPSAGSSGSSATSGSSASSGSSSSGGGSGASSAPGDAGSSGSGSSPGSGGSGGGASSPTPDPVAPAPVKPAPVSAGEPNSAQAASAVAFARDQIGDPYRFGGAGPSSWDCSGLTMMAYASVGIAIGGHSATAQYDLAASQGQLVPYSQVRVGDLIFYTDGGGDMYHVAIYSGSGLMIEAPYAGVPVREVPVRSVDRVGQVARPTAAAS